MAHNEYRFRMQQADGAGRACFTGQCRSEWVLVMGGPARPVTLHTRAAYRQGGNDPTERDYVEKRVQQRAVNMTETDGHAWQMVFNKVGPI